MWSNLAEEPLANMGTALALDYNKFLNLLLSITSDYVVHHALNTTMSTHGSEIIDLSYILGTELNLKRKRWIMAAIKLLLTKEADIQTRANSTQQGGCHNRVQIFTSFPCERHLIKI